MSSCLLEKQILSSVDKNEGDTANEKGRFFFLVEGNIQWLKTKHFIKHLSNKTTYLCYLPKAVLCFHFIL